MSFLDELEAAARSDTSVWHQFVTTHAQDRDEWYLFVEGQLDVAFYSSALRSVVGPEPQIVDFQCRGKRGVLTARTKVRRSHPNCSRVLFLVDRDLDDLTGSQPAPAPDLFCTRGYSIESYLVSVQSAEVIWQQVWALPSLDPRREVVLANWGDALAAFHRLMLPIMAWLVLAKRAGLDPNAGNLNLRKLFDLRDCTPHLRKSWLAHLKTSAGCHYQPPNDAWRSTIRQLKQLGPQRATRGKFALWFMARFVEEVGTVLRRSKPPRPNGSISQAPESIAYALIGKLESPPDLGLFFQQAASRSTKHDCN